MEVKYDPVRYSLMVGESWHHSSFKAKYCHNIFDDREIREEAHRLLVEALERNDIRYEEISFDSNHVHGLMDIGNYSRPQAAKLVKRYVAKKLLKRFPELKRKYFYEKWIVEPSIVDRQRGKRQRFHERLHQKPTVFFWFANEALQISEQVMPPVNNEPPQAIGERRPVVVDLFPHYHLNQDY